MVGTFIAHAGDFLSCLYKLPPLCWSSMPCRSKSILCVIATLFIIKK